MKYNWPGNIRELQHTIEKAVILTESPLLKPEDFMFKPVSESKENAETLEQVEKRIIESMLDKYGDNLTLAAKSLGITRQTLYNKMKRYDF